MTSAIYTDRRDVTGKQPACGSGMPMTLRCGACNVPKGTSGRRMKKVKGLRQYVCAACATHRPAAVCADGAGAVGTDGHGGTK